MINQTLLKKKNIAQCLGLMSSTDIRNVEILVPKLWAHFGSSLGGGIAEGVMGIGRPTKGLSREGL